MERSKREWESIVNSQKEQLARYEIRLKDVVTAYKGLLKEKEALELSLSAFVEKKDAEANTVKDVEKPKPPPEPEAEETVPQAQLLTLMNSLAILSAEKSRMEASFQTDKKQLRTQMTQKDRRIRELQDKLKEISNQAIIDSESYRAKFIMEREQHEKEMNNQMLMIRELQKLYGDERHLKENIEMQLNNLKTQFASNDSADSRIKDLQFQLKEAKSKIKHLINKRDTNSANESTMLFQQVQNEMMQLKEQHAIAIKSEQQRAVLAEERNKKLAAIHEDRVANLESRLAELSVSVGTYDRLRQQDQDSIQSLKSKIQSLEQSNGYVADSVSTAKPAAKTTPKDLSSLVDEIVHLKKLLIVENAKSSNPVNVSKLFTIGADHKQCEEDIQKLQNQLELAEAEQAKLQDLVQVQKTHIATLQDKVKVLNGNIEIQETEIKQQEEIRRQVIKEEREKWKTALSDLENDCRIRLTEMEQQLQNQRVRSLQLLDEKENEIKTLQTSYEVFTHPRALPNGHVPEEVNSNSTEPAAPNERRSSHPGTKPQSVGENCHMLHYANEIARKDIEIAGLRKNKYNAETALRKALQDKATSEESLKDRIVQLEQQVDRLERCKTREGANLEYLKNVLISFLSTKTIDGKQHMINAISVILQFTPAEIQVINNALHKK